ncbi:MAG: adenylate/guanylate cyclase domain-containing protein [Fimbriimonadaceae bacterium]
MSNIITPAMTEAAGERPAADWAAFAAYVRANPSGMTRPTAQLAEEFGIDEEFVRSFLAAMRAPVEQESFLEVGARAVRNSISVVAATVRRTFTELTARPWICLGGTLLAKFAVLVILTIFRVAWGIGQNFVYTGAAGALVGSIVVLGYVLQGVCYYRHAQTRYVIVATFIEFLGWLAFMAFIIGPQGWRSVETDGVPASTGLFLGAVFLALLYFLFAIVLTLIGSYSNYRQASREEVEVSRQELLDRLFMVDHRLAQIESWKQSGRMRWIDRLRTSKTFYLNVLFAGIAIGMLEVIVFGSYSRVTGRIPTLDFSMPLPLLFLAFGLFLIKIGTGLVSGFVAGRPGRSMSSVTSLIVGIWCAYWFPLGNYGPAYALGQLNPITITQDIFFILFFGALTGYGALIEDRNYRQQRLRTDDLPTLLAEQIQIQWRLGLGQQATTVMVVDVAKSTMMKGNADPLKIEWSFREYQNMVDEICRTHGGHVFSTAGDGAVVRFQQPNLAVLAAREILTKMPKFNMRRNRLDIPFRLRIGIHSGHTEANLADAPFNEVIDIAAHIEAVAPVGGIAVSKEVADALKEGDIELAEMARPVDGQQVFVVLNPTLESE